LGKKGNLQKFNSDESKAKYSITLQKTFYLKIYHQLLNQISSRCYVGGESTWTSGHDLGSGLLFSKKLLRPSIYDEKNERGSSLKRKKNDNYKKKW
jgi:hypothetical protein